MAITLAPIKPNHSIANASSPQAQGLAFWAPCGYGPGVLDPRSGLYVPPIVSAVAPRITASGLVGMDCTVNNQGARITTPATLNGLFPMSVMVCFFQVATPSAYGTYGGCTYTNTDAGPYNQYNIGHNSAGNTLEFRYNSAGTQRELIGSGVAANGAVHVLIATLDDGAQALYLDGTSNATAALAAAAPTYGTSQLTVGQQTSDQTTRNCGAIVFDLRLYSRALSAQDARDFTNQWTDLYVVPSVPWGRLASLTLKQLAALGVG